MQLSSLKFTPIGFDSLYLTNKIALDKALVAHYQDVQKKMQQSGKYTFTDLPSKKPKLPKSIDSEVAD